MCRFDGQCHFLELAAACDVALPLGACVTQPGGTGECRQPSLTLSFDRDTSTSPSPVLANLTVLDAAGAPWTGRTVAITAPGLTAAAVVEQGNGRYQARLTSSQPSGEYTVTAQLTVGGVSLSVQRVALVLPGVHPDWGQPEPVRGTVNTDGYEDGGSISPDGQWLALTDYSPVNAFCCITGCGSATPLDPASPFCNAVVGPYTGPERPDFPGAWRILGPNQVLNRCPSACFTSDYTATGGDVTNIALPPLGSYIFHRQPDGSFAEARFVGIQADGCVVPTGYSFVTATATTAELVYTFGPPFGAPANVHWAPITLGATNVLASFECVGPGMVNTVSSLHQPLANFTLGLEASNPVYRASSLMWDDEGHVPKQQYFSFGTGPLPTTTFSGPLEIPVGNLADDHSQPFFHEATQQLFYTSNGDLVFAQLTGSNPASAADWGAETLLLQSEVSTARPGSIIGMGQATYAVVPGGNDEVYFVYVVWTGTAINANLGMVPRR